MELHDGFTAWSNRWATWKPLPFVHEEAARLLAGDMRPRFAQCGR
jgi:hypothetical protein